MVVAKVMRFAVEGRMYSDSPCSFSLCLFLCLCAAANDGGRRERDRVARCDFGGGDVH